MLNETYNQEEGVPESGKSPSGKLKWLLILVLILILAGAVYLFMSQSDQPGDEQAEDASNSQEITTTQIPKEQIPEQFPTDLPIEEGAEITSNFEADRGDGLHQATREFISSRSMEENFELYNDYLAENGWTIETAGQVNDNLYYIFAKDGQGELSVNINRNTLTGDVAVDLSYVVK